MIKVLYVMSAILLFVLSIIIKKKEEKINLITTFFTNIILLSCYNIVVCLGLKIIGINSNLLILSIPNYTISAFGIYKIAKEKQIQKYCVLKKDIISISLIIIVGLIVSYITFGLPFNVPYVQEDASNHYNMITEFFETGEVKDGSIPGAYINIGILFKIFFNVNERFNGYNLFVITEIIKLVLAGILFYLTLSKYIKGKISYMIAILLSCIYMISYPLNGMLSGFVYLQMAVNIVNVILIVMENYKQINNKDKNILLFLLTFGLMFTYYILVPPVFVAIFLYELNGFKQSKIKVIKNLLVIFTLPCIIGLLFFVVPGLIDSQTYYNPMSNMASQDAHVGYIFVSYYSMFLFFVPFNIIYLIGKIRKKQIDFMSLLLIITILYIALALILQYMGLLARYYCMKPYYLLWLIMLVITGKAIFELLNKDIENTYKFLISTVFFIYAIGIIFFTLRGPCSFKVFEEQKETVNSIFNIYKLNRGIVLHETFEMVYTNEELKVLEEVTKDFDDNTKIIHVQDRLNTRWLRRLMLIKDENRNHRYAPMDEEQAEELQEYLLTTDEQVYVICYKNDFINLYFGELIEKLNESLNVVAEEGKLIIYSNK